MLWAWWLGVHLVVVQSAILPPPWADPSINPCANQPGGWLKLYWPQDGQCYRIFQRGAPCPETMELSPGPEGAECRCPPGQVQLAQNMACYKIYTKGPCDRNEYLAPLPESNRRRWGACTTVPECPSTEDLFWPITGKCYAPYTRGPCPLGQLLVHNNETGLVECGCSSTGTLSRFYWPPTKTCHQFYTRGPCLEKGALFLPGPQCDCHSKLPNYHLHTGQCYEIGGSGPCKSGHVFEVPKDGESAQCTCKSEHVPWLDGHCYRLYTQGPCAQGQLVAPDGTCHDVPCPRGKLYFPDQDTCHRVGVRGPCSRGQLVLFEQSVRSAIEGISYRGMCGCTGSESCNEQPPNIIARNKEDPEIEPTKVPRHAYIDYPTATLCENIGEKEVCHKLYTQGSCLHGEWLVPYRQTRSKRRANKAAIPSSVGVYIGHRFTPLVAEPLQSQPPIMPRIFPGVGREEKKKKMARCECRPGYSKGREGEGCRLPLIALAKFLNGEDYFK